MAKYNTTTRNARMDAVTAQVGTSGRLKIYTGTVPANPSIARTPGNLLVDIALPTTFAPAASNGTLTQTSVAPVNPTANGTATFADITTSGGTVVAQLTVSAVGGGGEVTLGSTTLNTGVPVDVGTIQLVEGNA